MRVISKRTLVEFYEKNPDAEIALSDWYVRVSRAKWRCFADVKNSFRSVDCIGDQRYVFNIKGNQYRLIAVIQFRISKVFVRFVGSHEEYDKIQNRIKTI